MLTFILYTILFWFSGGCFARYFYLSIQQDKVLDVLFSWQKMLSKFFERGGKWRLLDDMLGGCIMCFSSFVGLLWFVCYCVFLNTAFDCWIPTNSSIAFASVNFIWFLVFTSVQHTTNMLFITGKLFNK